ncbi:unnamed protein product [Heligmosomoides polygyrus]|uniref:Uncharacterized protein n=1 Tax=Heligmosomoides polygyrus TaxID=6339 RepID=A0A183G1M2_HELPZ|nr:unnamed protein product [Heligmosomoides polygyrus]
MYRGCRPVRELGKKSIGGLYVPIDTATNVASSLDHRSPMVVAASPGNDGLHSSLSRVRVLQWILLARGARRASYRSIKSFTKKSDQRVGGLPGVLLTSCGIQLVTLSFPSSRCLRSSLCGRPT